MNVLRYNEDIDYPQGIGARALKLRNKALEHFRIDYGIDSKKNVYPGLSLISQLPVILYKLGENIEGKTILDLGCGSLDNNIDDGFDRDFEPWLCRALPYFGVRSIGVDFGPLDGEFFEFYGDVELTKVDALQMVDDSSVDLVNSRMLFDSPSLKGRGIDPRELEENLIPQIRRVLKNNDCWFTCCSFGR